MPRKHKQVSISITPELLKRAHARAEQMGFGNSFSAYVAKLIRNDLAGDSEPGGYPSPGDDRLASSATMNLNEEGGVPKRKKKAA